MRVLDPKGHLAGTCPLPWQELGCDALVGWDPEQHQSWLRLPLSEAAAIQIRRLLSLGQGFAGRKKRTLCTFLSAHMEPLLLQRPPLPGALGDEVLHVAPADPLGPLPVLSHASLQRKYSLPCLSPTPLYNEINQGPVLY